MKLNTDTNRLHTNTLVNGNRSEYDDPEECSLDQFFALIPNLMVPRRGSGCGTSVFALKLQRDFYDVFGVLERHMMCIGCWRGDGKLERLSLDQFLM